MKTKFNKYFVNVLTVNNKTLADAALMSKRALKSLRMEAAKQCIADLVSIRVIRLEQEKRALAAQAAQMGMSGKVNVPTVKVEPEPVAVDMPKGVAKRFTLATTFGLNVSKGITITLDNHNPTHPMVPKDDKNYVFRSSNISDLCTFLQVEGETFMYLYGPTGCGKSSLIIESAARFGIPLYAVVGHSRMETPELFGGYKLNKDGGMDWIPGPITNAAKNDAWV